MIELTIAIPCYNGAAHIKDLFYSIKNLGLDKINYEVILVDNNSTDNTKEIVADLNISTPNLKYYRNQTNIGRIENWNKAVELSSGEFLILMNVNDRFLPFNVKEHLNELIKYPEAALLLTDIEFSDTIYPKWKESGLIGLAPYIKKTFLEDNFLEFHSLGVLQQHIFRTGLIKQHQIKFDPSIPRTTDRIFVGELIAASGNYFLYSNKSMVKWQLNSERYHSKVHINEQSFNFQELWINEYEANLKLSKMACISFKDFIYCQLLLSRSYIYKMRLRNVKDWFGFSNDPIGFEFPTAKIYYTYLSTIVNMRKIKINFFEIKLRALIIVIKEFLAYHQIINRPARSINELIKTAHINLIL